MPRFRYSLPGLKRVRLLRAITIIALSCIHFQSFGQILQIDRLKANYLVGFLDFAKWEPDLESEPKTIAVLSDADLYQELKRIAQTRTNGQELEIIRIDPEGTPPIDKIDVLSVEKSQDDHWQTIKGRCMEAGILLV